MPLYLAAAIALWGRASTPIPTRGDETDYYKLSHSLHQGTGYAIPDGEKLLPTRFPPVYPLVLSLFVPLEKISVSLLTLPAVAAFSGTLFLMFSLYRGSAWSIWITALYAVHFFSIYLAFRLRSEHLFMLLTFGTMLLYRRFKAENKTGYLAAAFLVSFSAFYTRTIGLVLPIAMLLLLLKDRRRSLVWPALLATVAVLPFYLKLTDTSEYLYLIKQLPKPRGAAYQMAFDICVHFGRNVIDFFTGFWLTEITRENSWPWLFIAKTAGSLAVSAAILTGLYHKVMNRGWEIEDVFFILYPVTFWILGIYSDMYRYFLPVFPMCIFYLLTALDEVYGIRRKNILIILSVLLPLFAGRTAIALLHWSRFYN